MNPKLLVQSLSAGLRGQILLAFLFAGKAMDVYELSEWTGRPRNAHGPHLRELCGAGMLARSSKRMAHGREIFLLGSEVLPLMQDLTAKLSAGKYLEEADCDAQVSDFPTSATPAIVAVARPPEEMDALNTAMTEHGIIGRTRGELIANEWVNAEYVRSWVEYEKWERQPEFAVARAINRMRVHSPQPERRANGHIENCQCSDCKAEDLFGVAARRKYFICPDCNQSPCACEEVSEYDPTGVSCVWMTETGERVSNYSEETRKVTCFNPCKHGSSHWCEEHYAMGVEMYGTGEIDDEQDGER